jgi:uncharacterized protein YbjT (DUF2867 family)
MTTGQSVLVLGASGGCGQWVTRLAQEAGHRVRALVRPGTPFDAPEGVDVRVGSALDVEDIAAAVEEQGVVISCIGPQRANPWNPWSSLRPPLGVAERSARAILDAIGSSGHRRLVAISAAGVGDSIARTTPAMRWLIAHSTIGEMYADLNRMEEVLRASGQDWVALRPVTLVNAGRPSGRARVLRRYRALSVVSRADVAAWLLAVASAAEAKDRTPVIGWW